MKGQFEVLEVGGYDNLSGAAHQDEISLEIESYEKKLVQSSKSINFNGESVATKYRNTQKGYLYHNTLDYYEKKDKGILIKFGINNDTGNIDRYSWIDVNYASNKKDTIQLSRDECLTLAKEYFDKFADSSEYELIEENYQKIPEYQAIYDFTFARVINGVETSEKASIGITVFGDVISHLFICLGEMKNVSLPTEEEFEIIQNNVDRKIREIYDNITDQYQYSYEIDKTTFVKLKNGRYAIEYYVGVDLEPLDSSKIGFGELTKLLVYVE